MAADRSALGVRQVENFWTSYPVVNVVFDDGALLVSEKNSVCVVLQSGFSYISKLVFNLNNDLSYILQDVNLMPTNRQSTTSTSEYRIVH